jgi:hypothetical protein
MVQIKFLFFGFDIVKIFLKAIVILFSIRALYAYSQDRQITPSAAKVFINDIELLPVDCFFTGSAPRKAGQTCQRNIKIYQLQSTSVQYTLLNSYNANSPFDLISKNCVHKDQNMNRLSFWCHKKTENWSIEISYNYRETPEINLIYLRGIELRTCASSNANEAFRHVIQKFGAPDNDGSSSNRLVFESLKERLIVTHDQSPPAELNMESKEYNRSLNCPGNYFLNLSLNYNSQFESGIRDFEAKNLATQSKKSIPRF